MNNPAKQESPRVDQFLTAAEARFDRWRSLLREARLWEKSANQQDSSKEAHRTAVSNSFDELRQWEEFFAYPGQTLLTSLDEHIGSGDVAATARLVQAASNALLTHSYRATVGDWESDEQASINLAERVPIAREEAAPHKPYFEVLVVSPARKAAWQELAQDLRKLRRSQDRFVYEPVFVASFEDAVLATILNGSI